MGVEADVIKDKAGLGYRHSAGLGWSGPGQEHKGKSKQARIEDRLVWQQVIRQENAGRSSIWDWVWGRSIYTERMRWEWLAC